MGTDRRDISRLLGKYFPSMPPNATSEDWHGFLDKITGLDQIIFPEQTEPGTPLGESNAIAFDRWRQALAKQGYPVWGITPERAAAIKARAEELKTEEAKRLKDLPELMVKLKQDAPLVTAAQLMKQAEAKP